MADDEESREIFGDDLGSLQQQLSRDLMQSAQRLPSMLQQDVEGEMHPVDLSPQEALELQRNWQRILVNHVQNLAGALDMARARLHKVEKRLDKGAD